MDFNQSKRCRFVTTVYIEGVNAGNAETLIGIDDRGGRVEFERAAIENGDAILLYEIDSDFSEFDDEEGVAHVFGDEEIANANCAAYHVAIEGDPREGFAYHIDAENQIAFIDRQGVTEEMPLATFVASAYRCNEAGDLLVHFGNTLERQYEVCKTASLTAHMAELDGIFERMKTSEEYEVQMRGFFHDVRKVPDDGISFEEIYQKVYLENRTPLHKRFELTDRTGGEWLRLIDSPTFRAPQVRQLLKFFLAERIGDFPVEEMSARMFSSMAEADEVLSATFKTRRVKEPFDGGSLIPGYKSSDVIEYDADGLTVIAFTDMGPQAYAYAYPTRRALFLVPAPDTTATPKV